MLTRLNRENQHICPQPFSNFEVALKLGYEKEKIDIRIEAYTQRTTILNMRAVFGIFLFQNSIATYCDIQI
jgi:hypothetical protein